MGLLEGLGPGRIGCQKHACAARSQACCSKLSQEEALCVPAGAYASNRGCPELEFDVAWVRYACDGQGDCPGTKRCCRTSNYDFACTEPTGTVSPCALDEMCVEDSDCHVSGARCITGECVTAKPGIDCYGKTCGPHETCCHDEERPGAATCATRCPKSWRRRDCHRNDDCLPGFKCCSKAGNNDREQRCYEQCPEPFMSYVCEDDTDCRGIKLVTADPNRPFDSPPLVDSICRLEESKRYPEWSDWQGDWYPVRAQSCYPTNHFEFHPHINPDDFDPK
jgi:hypothetical protein